MRSCGYPTDSDRVVRHSGVGQMREWFIKGLALSGVKPEDVPVELNI